MQIIADLHIHSRFSRAVSPQMTIEGIAGWARKKGIDLVATGDWTHPMWMREIGEKLEEDGSGLLKLKRALIGNENLDASSVTSVSSPSSTVAESSEAGKNFVRSPHASSPKFLLSTEISCIFSQGGKGRRVHTLVWVPTIAAAQKINKEMTKQGCNLLSDGRPIIGLSLINLAELVLTAEPNALIVPAHIYTPWFSVFGKMGGFESLEEAFGPYAKHIHAVETGLSSSPDMNWRIKELDLRAIISSSDAHSGAKLGREATVFEIDEHQMKECDEHMITYDDLSKALRRNTQKTRNCSENSDNSDNQIIRKSENQSVRQSENLILRPSEHSEFSGPRISYTIEFYPEEGKYHYTGHRDCNVRLTPEEVVKKGTTCSVCGKPLTQGVMQRVEEIASRSSNEVRVTSYEFNSIRMLKTEEQRNRPPFVMLVPLQEIIAEAIGSPVASKKTQAHYETLVSHFGGEFTILLHADLKEITKIGTVEIADGVRKVRKGDIIIDPGYDGVFGVVKIWKSDKEKSLVDGSKEQLGLF